MPDTKIKGLGHLIKLLHPSEDDYYVAIGKLITSYAKAEAAANILARKLSGLSDEAARLIFAGKRLDDVSEPLKNLAKLHKHKSYDDIDSVLIQLKAIKVERNKIAHWEAEYKKSIGIEFTNISIAKSLDNYPKQIFTIEQLIQMEQDCSRIYFRFFVLIHSELNLSDEILDWLNSRWSYQPENQQTKNNIQGTDKKKQALYPPKSSPSS